MTQLIWRESMSGKFCIMSNSKMELPKTIDEFLDKYPCGYSNSWRKIIRERGTQIKKNFRITIKGQIKNLKK